MRSGGKNVNPSKAGSLRLTRSAGCSVRGAAGFNTRKGLRKKGETATAAAATSPQNLSFIRPRPKQRLTQQTMQPMSQGLLAAVCADRATEVGYLISICMQETS